MRINTNDKTNSSNNTLYDYEVSNEMLLDNAYNIEHHFTTTTDADGN